ncbi:MAG: anti-sigma factor family protein [Longimicrobiales bacterium]
MPDKITHDDLMRFLDGELSPEEHERVQAAIAGSTELAREAAIFRAVKGRFQELSFHPGTYHSSVWDEVNHHLTRPIGWILTIAGVAVWAAYGAWVFLVSPVESWEKLATGAVVIGILALLASVIWERYREWLTDPYRDIQR